MAGLWHIAGWIAGSAVLLWFSTLSVSLILCSVHKIKSPDKSPIPDGKNGAYMIGHASVLIALDGRKILVDPILNDTVGFMFRRIVKPPVTAEEMADIDAICITHSHLDHFSVTTIRRFPRTVRIIGPAPVCAIMARFGFNDRTVLHPGDETMLGELKISGVKTEHYSAPDAVGFVIQGSKTIYHPGDTALNEEMFRDIGQRFAIDLVLMPIGAYRGLPPMGWIIDFNRVHISPEQAATAFELLGAKKAAAIHHGVFRLTTEPADEPSKRMRQTIEERKLGDRFLIPAIGEFVDLD